MLTVLRQLDDLLRGRKTRPDQLVEGRIELPLRTFAWLAVALGAIYGFFMGWFGMLRADDPSFGQLVASTIKLPALFLVTLFVTFPSLYVFNALVGCRLSFVATLRLLVAAIVVNVAVVASLGPILGFFTLSTTSYPFMILLNVLLLTVGGAVGLVFLMHTLRRLAMTSPIVPPQVSPPSPPPPSPVVPPPALPGSNIDVPPTSDPHPPTEPPIPLANPIDPDHTSQAADSAPSRQPGPLEKLPVDEVAAERPLGEAHLIFKIWVIIYSLVGVQTGWVLRPFIGDPTQPFTWFRDREGNFFQGVLQSIQALFSG